MSKRSDRPPEVAAPVIAGPDFCLVLHRRDACATRIRPKTGTAAAAGYFLLPWFLALTIMCGGCGKKLAPFAPDQLVAGPVREFRLSQEGDSLVLSWLLPKVNLLGQPLTQVQGCRVYRCEVSGVSPEATCPLNFVRCADIDLAYPRQGEVRGEAFIFQDRNLVPDHRYFYRVAAYDQDGYLGSWSPTLSHVWGWLPQPPLDLQATPGDRLVALRWSPVSRLTNGSPARDLKGYLIYRREGSGAWSQISPKPISQTAFQDVAVKNQVEYTYKVLAVRRLGGELLASADSALVSARPEKLTPPPPLLGLLAVPTSQGVELRWETRPRTRRGGLPGLSPLPGGGPGRKADPGAIDQAVLCGYRGAAGADLLLLRDRGGQLPPGQ